MSDKIEKQAKEEFEKWWRNLVTDHGYKMRYQIRDGYLAGYKQAWEKLNLCHCGEFDVEFGIHCNSCVKDRIEKLQATQSPMVKFWKENANGLEIELSQLQYKYELSQKENKKLRECVEFYADWDNECCGDYRPPNRARQCLKELGE